MYMPSKILGAMEIHPLLLLLLLSQLPIFLCCHSEERASLLSFKSFLSDPSGRLSSWQGQNCCKWYGIRCSNSHVIGVDLQNPNPDTFKRNLYSVVVPTSSRSTTINGTISPSLFDLRHLEYLDLSFNNFHFSKIPHQLANLKDLVYLNLSNSMFSGSITTQFTNLSSLQYLDVSCSFLIRDFSSVSFNFSSSKGYTNYTFSYYSRSYVSSPDISWVRGLVNLKILRLSGVDVSVATSMMNWAKPLSSLSDLMWLDLSNCSISSPLPTNEFLNLTRLSFLIMNSNPLNSSIPIQFANLTSLSIMAFWNCSLQGSIPYLPQLKELMVGGNSDLIVNLTSMFALPWPNLQTLFISSTPVIGSIPDSILNAPLLVSIFASGCSIQGSLPTSISNLSQLQYLDLSLNNITGYLPSSFSNLNHLQTVFLMQNNLQGPIPKSICKISSLRNLVLSANNFTGTVPSCINNLRNLNMFDVTANSIGGNVSLISLFNKFNPTWVSFSLNKITLELDQDWLLSNFQLQTLGLQSCNLKGNIPHLICNLTELITLNLATNNLTGTIPFCLFKLPNLSYLDLSQNNLEGILPHSLYLTLQFPVPILNLASNNLQGPLPLPPQNVGIFDLSRNKFTGEISTEFGERLSGAGYVSLSGNDLSGPIPISICVQDSVMRNLDLSKNQLSGTIPSTLKYCSSLVSLKLGANNLMGKIPSELGRLKGLKSLQLNDNALSGIFPSFLQQLHELEVLNIVNNNFEGNIPMFIGELHNLKILMLRSNKFNGSIPQEITLLHKLQILDLSSNEMSGPIPEKIGSLEMLKSRPNSGIRPGYEISLIYAGLGIQIVWKGNLRVFDSENFGIDLSCNRFEGSIPQEIGLLKGLVTLNLSHNLLSGQIPTSAGNMSCLQSLDLSFNNLTGEIPQSLTRIDPLQWLNLSYNNLSGRIPTESHFDTLSWYGLAYIGNPLLCGLATNKSCEGDYRTTKGSSLVEEDAGEKWLFYAVVALGYGVGFWGLFMVLLIRKEKWWFRYWKFMNVIALRMVGCMSRG